MSGWAKLIAAAAVLIVGSLIGLATLGFILQAVGWEPEGSTKPTPTPTTAPIEKPSWTYW